MFDVTEGGAVSEAVKLRSKTGCRMERNTDRVRSVGLAATIVAVCFGVGFLAGWAISRWL